MEQKRKLRDEQEANEKEKEMKLYPPKLDPQLLEVKARIEKLEEEVKEIVVETKKQSSLSLPKTQVSDVEKNQSDSSTVEKINSDLASNKAVEKDKVGKHDSANLKPELGQEGLKGSMEAPNFKVEEQKGQNQGEAGSQGTR